jgi:hypothetical protein
MDELRSSLRAAEDARDAAANRTRTIESALVERDGTVSAVRSQLASYALDVSRLNGELAAAVAQVHDVQKRLKSHDEDAAQTVQEIRSDIERQVREAAEQPTARMQEAVKTSASVLVEQQRLGAILEDHLAAESEIAVWYLHSGARSVPSKDVARALAALLEETRARLDEHKAGYVPCVLSFSPTNIHRHSAANF